MFEHRYPAVLLGTTARFQIVKVVQIEVEVNSFDYPQFLPHLPHKIVYRVERPGLIGGVLHECSSEKEAAAWVENVEQYLEHQEILAKEMRAIDKSQSPSTTPPPDRKLGM